MEMNGLHAVIVPYPAQGTINPLINLAHLLSSRGVFITFVNTEWSHRCMSKAADKDNDDHNSTSTFRFLSIPDGLPPDHGRLSNPAEHIIAIENLGPVLEHHLRCGLPEGAPPITCIIAESFMSCTLQVANNMGVPRVIFWPMCAASSIAQCNSNLLLSRGHIPVKVEELKREDKVITCLPGNLPPLLPSDLCSFYRTTDTSNVYFQWFLRESQFQSKADYVLVNTFDELEAPQTVSALSCNGCPALAVGPVFLPNFLEGKDLCKQASLLEQDESCLKWLDTQQPDSVIYVSFGSLAVSSNEQLEELAVGLEKSEHPFLWVLRMDIARGTPATLPEGFEERTKDRGVIVKWAPQVKVLSHTSVGGFLTHCGWNSTLESMSMGIPMLGWPHFSDQFLDCRFCKDVWKIGIDLEGVDVGENVVVRREEIEKGVRRLMEGKEAEELRKRGMELKEAAFKAVGEGGSSFLNLNRFIQDMMQLPNREL
ncbi:LOW QUALITY PROTEIN: linamarin synthase 2 [Cryptomeria japonica]|uniref:LOW QUALITY PROTEIN: linamarin synthase 2 n=1 Tax=Cryptomeria japonica TaxID=3369 RepID=UPI0027DA8BD7|nr:LOW QUALITY PROTEIN: linamarin synthase 2 [Cryptomeria japonica]